LESKPNSVIFGREKCSEHAVKKATEIKCNVGILGKPTRKPRSGITAEVKKLVLDAYEDDETSRIMSGSKDKVSLGNKVCSKMFAAM